MSTALQHAESIQGWMSTDELVWLAQTAVRMNAIAEIGCWKGRSTSALLAACAGLVYAVDHFGGSPDELEKGHKEAVAGDIRAEFLKHCGQFPNLRVIDRYSVDAAGMFRGQELDFVFIDASHRYEDVAADIRAWLPKARVLIAGHDYDAWEGVTRAVDEIFGGFAKRGPGSIWYFEVNG